MDIQPLVSQSITDNQVIEKLWSIYYQSFSGQESECIQDQLCFTRGLFTKAMIDTDWVKITVSTNNKTAGLAVCTSNLEKARVGYINPEAVRKKNNGYRGKILYTPIIAIAPKYQKSKGVFQKLIDTLADYAIRKKSMVFCDFSEQKNGLLPEIIVSALNKGTAQGRNNYFEIQDRQLYVAIKSESIK